MVNPTSEDLLEALAGLPLAADHRGQTFDLWYRWIPDGEIQRVRVHSVRWAARCAHFWAWRCEFLGEVLHWPEPIQADCLPC